MSEESGSGPDAGEGSGVRGTFAAAGVPHVHDRYFRAVMQGREEQVALVRAIFPALAPLLDPEAIGPLDGTFVDEDLTQRQTDLALRVRLAGREVIVYVLVEHQSTVDPLMAVRMQRYQSRIWDRYLREHPGVTTVPAILPAVVYQGQGNRRWTAATDLRDVLDLDEETDAVLAGYLPRLPYRLDDLTQVDVAALRGRVSTPPLLLMWLLFKLAPGSVDVVALLESLYDDFSEVGAGRSGRQDLTTVFTYIANVSDIPAGRLRPFAVRLGPVVEEALMTTAEMLRAEGQAELVLEQLAAKFGPQSAEIQERVRSASSSQLHTWGLRILTATSVAEVLD